MPCPKEDKQHTCTKVDTPCEEETKPECPEEKDKKPSFKSVNEKYMIIRDANIVTALEDSTNNKYWFPEFAGSKITLMSEGFEDGMEKTFDIYVSDFVQTSKVGLSMAGNAIESSKILLYHGKTEHGSDKLLSGNFTMNEKIETLTVRVTEKVLDSSTYSGKIFFENKAEGILISIPIDITIQRNPGELLGIALIGILIGIILVWRITTIKNKTQKTWWGKNLPLIKKQDWEISDDKPMIVTGLITAVSIPSLLIVSNELVGSYIIDTILAFGIGILVLLKLLKPKKR